MIRAPRIAYYISAHGFGHAARSAAVLKALEPDHALFLRTAHARTVFSRFGIDFEYHPGPVDSGCAQDDFLQINVAQTFADFKNFLDSREERLAREVRWLQDQAIDLVVSDVPSFPLAAAERLALPRLLLANFTWHDIYSGLPGAEEYAPLLDLLAREYALADLHILPQCHLPATLVAHREEVGFISLEGRDLRHRLAEELGVDLTNRLALFIYLGVMDSSRIEWRNLEALEDCVFWTRDPIPEAARPRNLFVLDAGYDFPDLIASADLVVTKAGYATLATAFTHGKPVISCKRDNFSEYRAMERYLRDRDVGVIIPEKPFFSGDWGEAIKQARHLAVKEKVRLNGAQEVRAIIRRRLNRP